MRHLSSAVVGLCLMAAAAPAATVVERHSSFWVFGDSLSDTGNLFAQTAIPGAPYVNGRFSNGPVWADLLVGQFTAAMKPAASFAFGFASAALDGPAPDLPEQLALFSAAVPPAPPGPSPLFALWFGANDVFRALEAGANPLDAATAAGQAVGAAVGRLAAQGARDFLLFNLPDLGQTPAFSLIAPAAGPVATAATLAFNAELTRQAATLASQGLTVTLLDVFGLFADIRTDPDSGFLDLVNPCFRGDALAIIAGLVPGCGDASGLLFWDSVHPTAEAHARIAAAVRDAYVAPIPLPAGLPLLAVALAGLGALRARR